jgi:UDP-N-acetyl-D-glucosamine dehydrogenase
MPTETRKESSLAAELEQRLVARTAHVGVIGLGYVGLPLIVELARAGFNATGVDLDERKIAAINRGESYIPDVPTSDVATFQKAGRLRATSDAKAIGQFDTINICVPTPLRKTKDPDLSYVVSAVEMIAAHIKPGQLIVLESTTYPGTTDEVVARFWNAAAWWPARISSWRSRPSASIRAMRSGTTKNVPKVVGGHTPACSRLARLLYSASIERVVEVSSPRVAEMVKLLENTFRAVNIGLVNELALMCDRLGISVWEVVDAAATKPFGFMPFYPGPGLGGHCIPIDPFYLSWKVKEVGFEARFIELAGHVNGAMPHHVVDKIADAPEQPLQISARIQGADPGHCVQAGYRRHPESPALDVMAVLKQKGADISYHDPFAPHLAAREWPGGVDMKSVALDQATLTAADCVVLITDHKGFNYPDIVKHAKLMVDTRNAVKTRHRTSSSSARRPRPPEAALTGRRTPPTPSRSDRPSSSAGGRRPEAQIHVRSIRRPALDHPRID